MTRGKIALFVIFFILLVDQLLKFWIKTHMYLGQQFEFTNWFIIHFTENPGMAFGKEFGGIYGKLALSIFRIVAIAAIIYYLRRIIKNKASIALILSVSLILAGAIGNLIDSALYGLIFDKGTIFNASTNSWIPYYGVSQINTDGYAPFLMGSVVDMFYFPLFDGHFPQWLPFWGGDKFIFFSPIFNIADSAISVGVAIILLFQKRFFKE